MEEKVNDLQLWYAFHVKEKKHKDNVDGKKKLKIKTNGLECIIYISMDFEWIVWHILKNIFSSTISYLHYSRDRGLLCKWEYRESNLHYNIFWGKGSYRFQNLSIWSISWFILNIANLTTYRLSNNIQIITSFKI